LIRGNSTGGRGFSFLFCLTAWLFTAIPSSHAYTLTQTHSGKNIRWHYGQKLFLAGNPSNISGISSESIWNAVVSGLQQWKRATQGMFDFDYWQGSNPTVYEPNQKQDGLNSIFFASQSNQKTDPNVIGYTQIWFNSESGNMIEADIILNDRDYILTDSPSDTSSHQSMGAKRVFINNVITHEIGHAIGLSHSNSINSSMLYVEFSEQNKLGCDDWFAAKHLYPSNNKMGFLSGTVLSPNGGPVAGAVVTAISISRGIPITSVHTDQSGNFKFGALEPGSVSLVVESYQGSSASIPPNMRVKESTRVCNQNSFPKNFVTENDFHTLKKFKINESAVTDTGIIQLNCNEVSEINQDPNSFSPDVFVDRGEEGTSKTYTFMANGPFKITGLGYLLLSPIKVSISLASQTSNILYRSNTSEFKIEDSILTGTAYGPITVKVDISKNELTSFPTPSVLPNQTSFYVINFNGNPESLNHDVVPNNARCDSSETLLNYQSPPGDPIRDSTTTSTRDGIGFCGNAHAADFNRHQLAHKKSIPTLGGILGWALPFLVAIACQLFLRLRRSKLKA